MFEALFLQREGGGASGNTGPTAAESASAETESSRVESLEKAEPPDTKIVFSHVCRVVSFLSYLFL